MTLNELEALKNNKFLVEKSDEPDSYYVMFTEIRYQNNTVYLNNDGEIYYRAKLSNNYKYQYFSSREAAHRMIQTILKDEIEIFI